MPSVSKIPELSESAIEQLKKVIDSSVANPKFDLPGASVAITNSKGDDLFTYASGYTGASAQDKLTTDSIFWIASCTKLLASIACLQLVERGQADLDSTELIEKYLPELKNLPIATSEEDGSIKLSPKKNKITLRHLLSHTSGLGYSFFSEVLQKYSDFFKIDEFDASTERELLFPLLFEPGSNWSYGVGIDWAGTLLSRITGKTLNQFITENILIPLHVEETGMEPDETLRKKFVKMNFRNNENGELIETDHIYKKVLKGDYQNIFHSGGAGVFSKPKEYIKVLATILNDGVSPKTGARILEKSTIDLMFTNQIPNFPNFARNPIKAANPQLTNPIAELYPQGDKPQGWGLSMFLNLHETATGRGNNSGWWCGLANLWWWIDRENDIAGFVGCQILPFGDAKVLKLWADVETVIYKDIKSE